jgi:acyl-CoA thioester hydrolase
MALWPESLAGIPSLFMYKSARIIQAMNAHHFAIELQVRDYECDIQGIVNNAVYQNYLEHCRHKFLQTAGIDFAQLHANGIDAVVIRAELDYKFPLRPGDDFWVTLKMVRQGKLRIVFEQQILRKTDEKIMVNARITAALTKNGRPIASDLLINKFETAGYQVDELN